MLTLNRSVKASLVIGLTQGLLLWLASTLPQSGVRIALATAVLVGGINLLGWSLSTIWLILAGALMGILLLRGIPEGGEDR